MKAMVTAHRQTVELVDNADDQTNSVQNVVERQLCDAVHFIPAVELCSLSKGRGGGSLILIKIHKNVL